VIEKLQYDVARILDQNRGLGAEMQAMVNQAYENLV
jgi:hypothetical protein